MARQITYEKIGWYEMFYFALPAIGAGYMFCLVNLYFMKFSTDILLIAPAVMGTWFFVSRLSDAITDPIAGYLSDKTKTRWGRRRPWVFGSIIPIGLTYYMLSAPPDALSGIWLSTWMGLGIVLFFIAQTIFVVPHMAWGAEMSDDYHERSKIFGARYAGWTGGYVLALISMGGLISAETQGAAAVRALAHDQALIAIFAMLVFILLCVRKLPERASFQNLTPQNSFSALRDIWKNPHARLIIIINFIENIGSGAILSITVYFANYVMQNPAAAPLFIFSYMIFALIATPIWIPLSRRIGKKRLWFISLLVTAFAFAAMFLAEPGKDWIVYLSAAIAGIAGSCGNTISPSIKSDIIDYDEYHTGERKEGAYYAAWFFVTKSAFGFAAFIFGISISLAGYVPNVAQNDAVVLTIRALYSFLPFAVYIIGAFLLLRFSLSEAEHCALHAELKKRRAGEA